MALTMTKKSKLAPKSKQAWDKSDRDQLNVYRIIYPVYILTRLFGLASFTVECDSLKSNILAYVSFFDFTWFLTTVFIYAAIAIFCIMQTTSNLTSDSYIMTIGSNLFLIFGYLMATVSVIIDMTNRNRIVQFMNILNEFDQKVVEIAI